MRFCPTREPASWPGPVPWRLVEDTGLLGQRQRTVYTHSHGISQNVSIFAPVSLTPFLIRGHKEGHVILAHTQWVVLQDRNPELREPKSFITGMPAFGSGGKYYLCLLKLLTTHAYLRGESRTKAANASLTRYSGIQEMCGYLYAQNCFLAS